MSDNPELRKPLVRKVEAPRIRRRYIITSIVVWTGIITATILILLRSEYLLRMVPVLAIGVIWFVIIVPLSMFKVE